MSRRVVVTHAGGTYDVEIGAGLIDGLGEGAAAALGHDVEGRTALCVEDSRLPTGFRARARASLEDAGLRVRSFEFEVSERAKSLETFGEALRAAANAGVDRCGLVVSIGGGIAGDLAGFVAASHQRGIAIVQCPTTLLSMVDASVGGKTGVNLVAGDPPTLRKNAVGAFLQPTLVVADTAALASLPARELRSGLAECVKHAMLDTGPGDALREFGNEIDAVLRGVDAGDWTPIEAVIERGVRFKAGVVERDERETDPGGGRALLNLGHTYAHAIETLDALTCEGVPGWAPPMLHGEAVALGLAAASEVSVRTGRLDESNREMVEHTLRRCGLAARVGGLPSNPSLRGRMSHDKKTLGGRLRLVLPLDRGAELVPDLDTALVDAGWDRIRC